MSRLTNEIKKAASEPVGGLKIFIDQNCEIRDCSVEMKI